MMNVGHDHNLNYKRSGIYLNLKAKAALRIAVLMNYIF